MPKPELVTLATHQQDGLTYSLVVNAIDPAALEGGAANSIRLEPKVVVTITGDRT